MKVILLILSIVFLFVIDFYVLKATKQVFAFPFIKTIIFNIIYWLPLTIISIATIYGVYALKEVPGT